MEGLFRCGVINGLVVLFGSVCRPSAGIKHPAERWEAHWVDDFPKCVPCHGVPDGPLAANGDLGIVLGGAPGTAFQYKHGKPEPRSLGIYMGKNDFWGWPGSVTYHASFEHFSVGYLLLDLQTNTGAINLTRFSGSQRVVDGYLQASASAPQSSSHGSYGIAVSGFVLSDRNVVLMNVTASCPAEIDSVLLKMTLGSDNFFDMPLMTDVSADGTLTLRKKSVKDEGFHHPVMTPCSQQQIVYNGLRTFALDHNNTIWIVNGSSRDKCFLLRDSDVVVSSDCNKSNLTGWQLKNGRIELPAAGLCLGVTPFRGNSTACPPQSYYTDPSPTGACQSVNWTVAAVACHDDSIATEWTFDAASGFLHSSTGKCLTAVPQSLSNNIGVAAKLSVDDRPVHSIQVGDVGTSGVSSTITSLKCGKPAQLAVGVVSERDTDWKGNELEVAQQSATIMVSEIPGLINLHSAWWNSFWERSLVDFGGSAGSLADLEFFYYSMMYLMRSSMRSTKVAPSLWGPFSTTDFPGWSDDMTLDYNFEANFWSAATSNHAELIQLYVATILDSQLVPLAQQRAALADWSLGGWPDQFGAEVMGMSCGPTPDWDHDFGCKPGFGGFKGLAFVSCTGPFDGMACSFDDGTRWVAGLVATPLLQYYDATQNKEFLLNKLLPYIRGVADFYSSYATWNASTSHYDILFTCAQETCNSGLSPKAAEHNAHQDLAYARMVYSRLLEFTDPQGVHGAVATEAERKEWSAMLSGLVPFPTVPSKLGPVFPEAVTYTATQPAPDSNAAFPISHFAAMHPAAVVGPDSPSELLDVARNTVLLNNIGTSFAPLNGLVLAWPPAARIARQEDSQALLTNFTRAFRQHTQPNGWPNVGGGGLEQIGALEAFHLLMLRGDAALRIFPAWPKGSPARFENLRAPGAFLVSAQWDGQQVSPPFSLTSLAGRNVILETPWPGHSFCACVGAGPPKMLTSISGWPDRYDLETKKDMHYKFSPCESLGGVDSAEAELSVTYV